MNKKSKLNKQLMQVRKKILSLNNNVLKFMRTNIAEIVGLVAAVSATAVVLSTISLGDHPTITSEFAETSVIVTGMDRRAGGSGVILRSNNIYSEVLTNKHVCRLAKSGGVVIKDNREYLVSAIKQYPYHDLCLVKVFSNLGINTELSTAAPDEYEDAVISGHPALLPHVTTSGNFSGSQIINIVIGLKKCTKKDLKSKLGAYCYIFGAMPILQPFEAQLVTGTILPGSSGSGVFNSRGEIAGLVFAGRGRGLGYAFIVPQVYIADFLSIESQLEYVSVNRTRYDDLIRSVFDSQDKCKPGTKTYKKFKKFCDMRQDYMIWKK